MIKQNMQDALTLIKDAIDPKTPTEWKLVFDMLEMVIQKDKASMMIIIKDNA